MGIILCVEGQMSVAAKRPALETAPRRLGKRIVWWAPARWIDDLIDVADSNWLWKADGRKL